MAATLYQVLEVEERADAASLRRAFLLKAKAWHPDSAPEGERARQEARFQKLSEAYETLSDPARRDKYDRELRFNRANPRRPRSEQPSSATPPRGERWSWDGARNVDPTSRRVHVTQAGPGMGGSLVSIAVAVLGVTAIIVLTLITLGALGLGRLIGMGKRARV